MSRKHPQVGRKRTYYIKRGNEWVAFDNQGQVQTAPGVPPPPAPAAGGTTKVGSDAGWSSGWNTFPKKTCSHYGIKPVATLRSSATLYVANARNLSVSYTDLILDLAGSAEGYLNGFVRGSQRFRALNELVHMPEIVRLMWDDYDIPPVGLDFWLAMLPLLDGHVTITCIGGHGRSGTAVAALLVADGWDAQKAIDHVRQTHCELAIETRYQEEYVLSLRKVQL